MTVDFTIEDMRQLVREEVKEVVEASELRVTRVVSACFSEYDDRFDRMEARFNAMDVRFDAVEIRLDAVDARFETMDARLDAVGVQLASIDGRLGRVEDHTVELRGVMRRYAVDISRLNAA